MVGLAVEGPRRIRERDFHVRDSGKLAGMHLSDIERIMAFENRFAKAQASDVVDIPFGFAVLQEQFPHSHYHNRIAVTSSASAADMIAAAEDVLGGAGLGHRYISVDDRLGDDLTADFAAAGYEHETIATMIYSGPEIELASHEVSVVSLDAVRPTIIRDWRVTIPDATDEVLRQLADRKALSAPGVELALLAVHDGDEIAAHADLYVDRVDRIAQFEDLVTGTDFRGRGYGGALLHDALRRGRQAGSELFFLTADLNDWPHDWYQRFGFVDAARAHHFSRRE